MEQVEIPGVQDIAWGRTRLYWWRVYRDDGTACIYLIDLPCVEYISVGFEGKDDNGALPKCCGGGR